MNFEEMTVGEVLDLYALGFEITVNDGVVSCIKEREEQRMIEVRDVSSNAGVCDITQKEITIPLAEYTDLIAKEAVLGQIIYAVSKENDDDGTIGILKAILQIDTPKEK